MRIASPLVRSLPLSGAQLSHRIYISFRDITGENREHARLFGEKCHDKKLYPIKVLYGSFQGEAMSPLGLGRVKTPREKCD